MNKATLKNILNKTRDIFSTFQKKDKDIKNKIKKLKMKVYKKKTDQEIEKVREQISEL